VTVELRTEAFFQAVADGTYDWESWMDQRGRLRWVNPAVERISGYGVDACYAMIDYPLPIVLPEDRPVVERVLSTARAGGSGNDVEFRMLEHGTGRVRWGAISWQPFRGPRNEPLGYRTSVRDIDERKQAEVRLRQAMVAAEQANRAKSEFLAIVSHELRTPLQTIAGYSDLLGLADLPPRERQYVRVLKQENESLLRLVGDLLDLSSLQAHTLELRTGNVDLRELLAKVLAADAPRARAKGLTLRPRVDETVPTTVLGDEVRLREVLSNLIGNALKFTAEGGVTVDVTSRRTGSTASVTFTVRDTGIGIPADKQQHLFTPFFQADSSTGRRFGGTGLGLAIARRLVELMGGTIVVASDEGRGAAFSVEIPFVVAKRSRGKASPPTKAAKRARPTAPRRILLVDDSAAAREVGCELLVALGRTVSVATSGSEALAKLEHEAFDLVLLDLQMPDVDGFAVARILRESQKVKGPLPRIVALTASALDAEGVLAAGREPTELFDAILQKPMRLGDLAAFLGVSLPARRSPAPTSSTKNELAAVRTADGTSLLDRLRLRFGPEVRDLAHALRAAGDGNDRRALGEAAHKAKGLALLVGASDAVELAEELGRLAARPRVRRAMLASARSKLVTALRRAERALQDPA
jgi:PAS domain S-box-containing protein